MGVLAASACTARRTPSFVPLLVEHFPTNSRLTNSPHGGSAGAPAAAATRDAEGGGSGGLLGEVGCGVAGGTGGGDGDAEGGGDGDADGGGGDGEADGGGGGGGGARNLHSLPRSSSRR